MRLSFKEWSSLIFVVPVLLVGCSDIPTTLDILPQFSEGSESECPWAEDEVNGAERCEVWDKSQIRMEYNAQIRPSCGAYRASFVEDMADKIELVHAGDAYAAFLFRWMLGGEYDGTINLNWNEDNWDKYDDSGLTVEQMAAEMARIFMHEGCHATTDCTQFYDPDDHTFEDAIAEFHAGQCNLAPPQS